MVGLEHPLLKQEQFWFYCRTVRNFEVTNSYFLVEKISGNVLNPYNKYNEQYN